jgi:hypothetical protein
MQLKTHDILIMIQEFETAVERYSERGSQRCCLAMEITAEYHEKKGILLNAVNSLIPITEEDY